MEAGQMEKGEYLLRGGANYNQSWLSRAQSGLTVTATINKYLKIIAGLEGEGFNYIYNDWRTPGYQNFNYNVYITQAQGIFSYGEKEGHHFELGVGKFDFKYNPDSRDLGEYMFRSTPYPQTLWTDFDFSMVRLLGFHLDHHYSDILNQHLLFTSAIDHFPLGDWSLSYLGDVNFKKMIELGAGISLHRWFSVNEQLTRPIYENTDQLHVEKANRLYYVDGTDSLMVPFSGIILEGRLSFDPKRLIFPQEENGIFGKEDLKFYSEAAILGVKDYPMTDTNKQPAYAYNNIWNRIPLMLGFDIPTFKAFDVFSLECEYWNDPYPNSLNDILKWSQASPGLIKYDDNGGIYNKDNYKYHWKWSIYCKKTIFDSFQAIFMVANDHFFIRNVFDLSDETSDFEQTFRKEGDWYWMLKFRYLF